MSGSSPLAEVVTRSTGTLAEGFVAASKSESPLTRSTNVFEVGPDLIPRNGGERKRTVDEVSKADQDARKFGSWDLIEFQPIKESEFTFEPGTLVQSSIGCRARFFVMGEIS